MDNREFNEELKKAKRGDADAFGKLYESLSQELYRFALWYTRDTEDAKDAVQDACLKAFKNIRSLKNEKAFRPWFFKILLNCCKDIVSSDEKKLTSPLEEAESLAASSDCFDTGDANRLFGILDDADKRIVAMSVIGGFKSGETGKALGLKASTVRSRLARALKAMREEAERIGYQL